MAVYSSLFFHIPHISPIPVSFLHLDPLEDPPRKSRSSRSLPRPKPEPKSTIPAVPHRNARSQDPPRRKHRQTSSLTSTTISTHQRVTNRTDALARLEGRVSPPRPVSPPPYSPYAAVHRTKSAAPVLATKSFIPLSDDDDDSDDDYDDDDDARSDDVHLDFLQEPPTPDPDHKYPLEKLSRPRSRSRRRTIDSWLVGPPPSDLLPNNFIDLGDLDLDHLKLPIF